jgi:hypothetical protein
MKQARREVNHCMLVVRGSVQRESQNVIRVVDFNRVTAAKNRSSKVRISDERA